MQAHCKLGGRLCRRMQVHLTCILNSLARIASAVFICFVLSSPLSKRGRHSTSSSSAASSASASALPKRSSPCSAARIASSDALRSRAAVAAAAARTAASCRCRRRASLLGPSATCHSCMRDGGGSAHGPARRCRYGHATTAAGAHELKHHNPTPTACAAPRSYYMLTYATLAQRVHRTCGRAAHLGGGEDVRSRALAEAELRTDVQRVKLARRQGLAVEKRAVRRAAVRDERLAAAALHDGVQARGGGVLHEDVRGAVAAKGGVAPRGGQRDRVQDGARLHDVERRRVVVRRRLAPWRGNVRATIYLHLSKLRHGLGATAPRRNVPRRSTAVGVYDVAELATMHALVRRRCQRGAMRALPGIVQARGGGRTVWRVDRVQARWARSLWPRTPG